jgi:hypothetical protein
VTGVGGSGGEPVLVIPTEEIDHLTETVDAAIGLAAEGSVGEGYRRLSEGRARADLLRIAGRPWAAELLSRWAHACDTYTEAYGVPILE